MPKEGPHCICLSAVLIYFAFKLGKKDYCQVFLKKCKYIVKKKKNK